MENHERIEMLEEAREHLEYAIELLEKAIRRTPIENRAHAYVVPALKMSASASHEYLGCQTANIDELIHALEDGEDDDQ
jgi:predicted deacetylase